MRDPFFRSRNLKVNPLAKPVVRTCIFWESIFPLRSGKSSLMLPVGELHKAPHQRPLRNVESPRGKSLTGDSNDSIKPSFLSPSSSSSSPSSPLPSCAVFLHRILYDTSVQQGQTERGESKGLLCNTSLKSKNAAGSHRPGGVI